MSCPSVAASNSKVSIYPKDDYESAVNFTLAQQVSKDEVTFVNFNAMGKEVAATELINYPTKVLIHGWLTSIEKSPWFHQLRDAYINEPNAINVIYVDYQGPASQLYTLAAPTAINVAKLIAKYLSNTNIHLHNIHLVGHSLGSHVAGFVGRRIYHKTGKKIGRITLLDPAGVKFDKTPERVSEKDATFVDVIHTDDGHYGLNMSVGHMDVFPNGGAHQPGCPSVQIDDNCSHARSTQYFVESVSSRPKVCRSAASWADFQNGNYLSQNLEIFGEHVSHTARGNYFFATEATAPFFG